MGLPKSEFIKKHLRTKAPGAFYYYGRLSEVAPRLRKLREMRCTIDEALLRVRKRRSTQMTEADIRPPAAKRRRTNGSASYEPVYQEEKRDSELGDEEEEEEEAEAEEEEEEGEKLAVYIIYTVDVTLHMYAPITRPREDGEELTGAAVVNAILQRWVVDLIPYVDELVFAMDGPSHTRPPIKMLRTSRKGIACFAFTGPVSDTAFPDGDQWATQKSDPDFHYQVVEYLTGALIKRVRQEVIRKRSPGIPGFLGMVDYRAGSLKRLVIDISVPSNSYGEKEDYFRKGMQSRTFDFSKRYCATVMEFSDGFHCPLVDISFLPRVYNRNTRTGCDTCEADAALFSYIADARARIRGKRIVGLITTNDTDAYVYSLAMAERFAAHHEGVDLVIVGKNFRTKKPEDRGVWTKRFELIHMTAVREAIAQDIHDRAVERWEEKWLHGTPLGWIEDRLRGCVLCVCLILLASGCDFNPGLGSYLGLPPKTPRVRATRVPLPMLLNHLPGFLTRNRGSRQKMITLLPRGEFRVDVQQCMRFIAYTEAQRKRPRKPGRTDRQMMKFKATWCNATWVLGYMGHPGDDAYVQNCLQRSPGGKSLHGWIRDAVSGRVYQDLNVEVNQPTPGED